MGLRGRDWLLVVFFTTVGFAMLATLFLTNTFLVVLVICALVYNGIRAGAIVDALYEKYKGRFWTIEACRPFEKITLIIFLWGVAAFLTVLVLRELWRFFFPLS